jgi:hypothetical protein
MCELWGFIREINSGISHVRYQFFPTGTTFTQLTTVLHLLSESVVVVLHLLSESVVVVLHLTSESVIVVSHLMSE